MMVQGAELKQVQGYALRTLLHTDMVVKNFLTIFNLVFNFLQREILNTCSAKIIFWMIQLQSNFRISQTHTGKYLPSS